MAEVDKKEISALFSSGVGEGLKLHDVRSGEPVRALPLPPVSSRQRSLPLGVKSASRVLESTGGWRWFRGSRWPRFEDSLKAGFLDSLFKSSDPIYRHPPTQSPDPIYVSIYCERLSRSNGVAKMDEEEAERPADSSATSPLRRIDSGTEKHRFRNSGTEKPDSETLVQDFALQCQPKVKEIVEEYIDVDLLDVDPHYID